MTVNTRNVPWFELPNGVFVDTTKKALTSKEIIKKAGLDWEVEKVPLYAIWNTDKETHNIMVEDKVALQRQDNGEVLGVSSPNYHIVSIEELFEWTDHLQESGAAKHQCAVSLEGGKKIMVVDKFEWNSKIDNVDTIDWYLMSSNSYDGSMALSEIIIPVRVDSCTMQRMDIPRLSTWKARHKKGAVDKVSEARKALDLTLAYIKAYETAAEAMLKKKININRFDTMLDFIYELYGDPESRKYKTIDKVREEIKSLYLTSPNLSNITGTAWGAYSAVCEYLDWHRRLNNKSNLTEEENDIIKAETHLHRFLFDVTIKDKALNDLI